MHEDRAWSLTSVKLVHELNVGQLDLFKTEELLDISRIQDVWRSSVMAAELVEVQKPPGLDSRISGIDVGA